MRYCSVCVMGCGNQVYRVCNAEAAKTQRKKHQHFASSAPLRLCVYNSRPVSTQRHNPVPNFFSDSNYPCYQEYGFPRDKAPHWQPG